jgi:hypothetical protein
MQYKTYLQIVNEAISECKVSLDPLTSVNFASPPRTQLYEQFKTWTNRVYKDILMDRNEWFFRKERSTVTVYPRLQLRAVGLGTVTVGDELVGASSGVRIEILAIHTVEDVEQDATLEYTVSVEYVNGTGDADNIILNEEMDRLSPSAATGVCRVKGRGRYSFVDLNPYIDEIDANSFSVQRAVDFNTDLTSSDLEHTPNLMPITPEAWQSYYAQFDTPHGRPAFIVRTTDGNWDFHPRPAEPYDVSFTYSQDMGVMTVHSDTPVLLPAKYCDRIMWGIVAEYADFDERPRLYARAAKWIKKFDRYMVRDELPAVSVDLYRFDR